MRTPTLVVLLSTLALVLSGCGGMTEAEQHYNTGVDLDEQGQLDEAIAEYSIALELDPDLAVAYSKRGLAYLNLGLSQRAIQDYNEAIRLNPQDTEAYNNRGGPCLPQPGPATAGHSGPGRGHP